MEPSKWRRRGHFWAGATCAALWTWLALALTSRIILLILQFPWGSWVWVIYGFVALVSIFYGAGIIAAFFWHAVVGARKSTNWSVWVVLFTLLPVFVINKASLILVIFLFPFTVLPFIFGAEWGEDFWKHRRYRHLFGLANDWERDEDER